MINRYDMYEPYHPDGADDPDELPGGPAAGISWLDDEDPLEDDASLNCGACGQPAGAWIYEVATDDDGSSVIAGFAVCTAHQAAA